MEELDTKIKDARVDIEAESNNIKIMTMKFSGMTSLSKTGIKASKSSVPSTLNGGFFKNTLVVDPIK